MTGSSLLANFPCQNRCALGCLACTSADHTDWQPHCAPSKVSGEHEPVSLTIYSFGVYNMCIEGEAVIPEPRVLDFEPPHTEVFSVTRCCVHILRYGVSTASQTGHSQCVRMSRANIT